MTPKFRAWLTEDKLMPPVAGITFFRGCMDVMMSPNKKVTKVNQVIKLMQSTGLKDKNGKEIFEGDIVKFSDCDDDAYVTPVVWDKNYACFGVSFSGKYPISFDYLEEFYTELKDIEVVGNIYENPEFLEGE